MSARHSLAARFGRLLAVAGLVAVGATALLPWRLTTITAAYERVLATDVANASAARVMQVEFKKQVQEWKNILLRGERADLRERHRTLFAQQRGRVDSIGVILLDALGDTASLRHLRAFRAAHAELGTQYDTALVAYMAAPRPVAQQTADQRVMGQDREPTNRIDSLVLATDHTVAHETAAVRRALALERRITLGIAIIILAGFTFVFRRIVRDVTTPIRALQREAGEMASGDVRPRPLPERADEIGILSNAMTRMREAWRALLGDVHEAAGAVDRSAIDVALTTEQVHAAALAVSSAARTIAEGSIAQTDRVQAARHTAEEVATRTHGVAADAMQAAGHADVVVGRAQAAVHEGVGARHDLDDVASAVREAAPGVPALRGTVGTVEEVVVLVRDLVDQSHLLAVNAAIEAARAGPAGRGFGVVAQEMRHLASESGASLERIGAQLRTITRVADTTAGAIETIDRRVAAGHARIAAALSALDEIAVLAGEDARMLRAMTARVTPLRDVTARLAHDLGTIADVAEQNAAAAEEVSASAIQQSAVATQAAGTTEQLRAVSRELITRVGRFRYG